MWMWKLFKEYIWDFVWGKVLSVIGSFTTIWSIVLLFSPSIYNEVPPSIRIDSRIWYGLAIAFLIFVCIRVLYKSSQYREQAEGKDNIQIIYSERRHIECRQTESGVETIRVGYRVREMEDIEAPVVLPSTLFKISRQLKYTKIPIVSTPLSPMVKTAKVHHGLPPEYWIDVFRHIIGSSEIEMCYDNFQFPKIPLSSGRYELTLIARGTPSREDKKILTIFVSRNNSLRIVLRKVLRRNVG